MSEDEQYECGNLGCDEVFKYRVQRSRHKKLCLLPPSENEFEEVPDGVKCKRCGKVLSHKKNYSRHRLICVLNDENASPTILFCPEPSCSKSFAYPSKLKKHMESHQTPTHECDVCHRKFKREDYYRKHKCKANPLTPNGLFSFDDSGGPAIDGMGSLVDPLDLPLDLPPNLPTMMDIETEDSPMPESNTPETEHLPISSMPDSNTSIMTYSSTPVTFLVEPSMSRDDFSGPPLPDDEIVNTTPFVETLLLTPPRVRQNRKSKAKSRRKSNTILQLTKLMPANAAERKDVLSTILSNQEVQREVQEDRGVELKVANAFMSHLKQLYVEKKYSAFYKILRETFTSYDEDIANYIATVTTAPKRLVRSRLKAVSVGWTGRPSSSLQVRQSILDLYIEYSIFTVDRRNGRDKAKIRKDQYVKFYDDLNMPDTIGLLGQETNKRGIELVTCTKRVLTATLQTLQQKLKEVIVFAVSRGTILNYKPFFIGYATEKEKILCMCILCLNMREIFNCLMSYIKTIHGEVFSSISKYLMQDCNCEQSLNGYYEQDCCLQKCGSCKVSPPKLPQNSEKDRLLNYYQFEQIECEYINKKGEKKTTKRTERVEHSLSVSFLHSLLISQTTKYTYHRYQICNDKYEWPTILGTVGIESPIFHMDYSENLQLTPKFEPQSAHFNKMQSTLHCTVAHTVDEGDNHGHKFLYHFTNDNSHDAGLTFSVINEHVQLYPDADIYRFKSDNCSSQYKCKHVFYRYMALAKQLNKTFLVYFGVPGDGKGLVDAMSGFGAKGPLRKAIVQHDKYFENSAAMVEFLDSHDGKKENWYYSEIENEKIASERKVKEELQIKGCGKLHILAFLPSGLVYGKQNMCSCPSCLKGELHRCKIEKGVIFNNRNNRNNNSIAPESEVESDDGSESGDNAQDEEEEDEEEENELSPSICFEIITVGNYIAIYSFSKATELFYICKVHGKGVACGDMVDNSHYHHLIQEGESYIAVNYLEKVKEKRRKIVYKLLDTKQVFILSQQVFFPCVPIQEDLTLAIQDYQFLCDCI